MRPARWPRSPPPRRVVADRAPRLHRPRRRRCWASRNRCGCSGSTRPAEASPAGILQPRRGRWVRVDPWDTGFVDLAGDQGLLGQRDGRTSAAVVDWLSQRSPQFRGGHRVRGDRPGRGLRGGDPHPGPVAQRDDRGRPLPPGEAGQRRADQGAPPRHLGPARSSWPQDRPGVGQPAPTAHARGNACRTRASPRCGTPISAEDPSAQILSAWIAKEELRTLLSTVRRGGDAHLTRHRLHRFLTWCIDSQIPELLTLAATIDTWWPEINAFVQHRHHQRPHRGLQPAGQAGQTRRLRIPEPRALGPPDTIPLHPQTAGRNPDFMLIARPKSNRNVYAGPRWIMRGCLRPR